MGGAVARVVQARWEELSLGIFSSTTAQTGIRHSSGRRMAHQWTSLQQWWSQLGATPLDPNRTELSRDEEKLVELEDDLYRRFSGYHINESSPAKRIIYAAQQLDA
ncbi:hypothetical protein BV898_05692 [Hypsibius exemplaris]|uniref:Uncharacterized protein n=1 Tax=Hypsibius exemplaris TaxID=2072580 RepID=A0A1W0WYX1_HYPEX|nr:hypothetical protein BV898_05692 [Hypsibius exemplaris]